MSNRMVRTRQGKELAVPSVHLNGTCRSDLVSALDECYAALTSACRALQKAAPHERDYYVQGDGAFRIAKLQAEDRMQKLVEVMDEIAAIEDFLLDEEEE